MTIRFHLDEHISPAIAVALLAEDRVIVTHDTDYLVHHSTGIPHAGIAFCRQQKYKIGDLFRALQLLHGGATMEEVRSQIVFL